jgi:hypothetical protein
VNGHSGVHFTRAGLYSPRSEREFIILIWSEAKIWRIETGQTSLRSFDVEAMCKIYTAPADLTEALMGLAKVFDCLRPRLPGEPAESWRFDVGDDPVFRCSCM